jgi:hypothetical protein
VSDPNEQIFLGHLQSIPSECLPSVGTFEKIHLARSRSPKKYLGYG